MQRKQRQEIEYLLFQAALSFLSSMSNIPDLDFSLLVD